MTPRSAAPAARTPKLRSRLRASDVVHLGTAGLRTRPLRAVLSALGIAIGIASMVAVVSISVSSRERLNKQLAALGSNLLTVRPGESIAADQIPLPADAVGRIERIDGVESASTTAQLADTHVYRSSMIDARLTAGITVQAADLGLCQVVGGEVERGSWLNRATAAYPAVVLGSEAAKRLGVVSTGGLVWLGDQNVAVVGILKPIALAPELDSAALIGIPVAERMFGFHGHPTTIYERSSDESVPAVRTLLGPTVQPQQPGSVEVSRPSDMLVAKNAADDAFTGLLLALGSIGLLVGGIGVANTMVISVLERRREIGLRRALGATRRHIRLQFLTEALLLSTLGGMAGAGLGAAVSAGVAQANGWIPVVPIVVVAGGVGATTIIGAIAGLYPALRAARTPPTVALSS